MSVILSIKPKYAMKIFSGEKKVEFRKKVWIKINKIKKVYLYVSGHIGQILGTFLIENILKENPKTLWYLYKEVGGISKEEFDSYFNNTYQGNGIYIKNPVKFKQPIDPYELDPNFRPPQNFMYVRKDLEKKLEKMEVV